MSPRRPNVPAHSDDTCLLHRGEKVVVVDGRKVRDRLDPNFGKLARHSTNPTDNSPKWYIPKNTVWIDYRYLDELGSLLEYEQIMASVRGKAYDLFRRRLVKNLSKAALPPEFSVRTERHGSVIVRYVDGKLVRKFRDPDFEMGGHGYLYSYIPENEVWIDVKVDPDERPFILAHELEERRLMKQRKTYAVAHEYATVRECELRREAGNRYPGDPDFNAETGISEIFLDQFIYGKK